MSVICLLRELVTRPLAKKKTKSKYAGDFGTLFTVGYELGEVERTRLSHSLVSNSIGYQKTPVVC